jgi:hypothetical protein
MLSNCNCWLANIGQVEEVKEEEKVGAVHDKGPLDVLVGDTTGAAALLHLIRRHVHIDADDHLGQLRGRDCHVDPFGNAHAHGTARVVRIHGRVHCVVDEREPAARRAEVVTRVPAVDEHSGVVVPVEEYELLLTSHDEECVEELGHLAQYEQPSLLEKEKGHDFNIEYDYLLLDYLC